VKIPTSWKKVTPFSKSLALALVILLPFIGFYLGIKYQKLLDLQTKYAEKIRLIKAENRDSPQDLLDRCGEIPEDEKLDMAVVAQSDIRGPVWSPNCRYVAWSSSNADDTQYEGLFLYSFVSKKTSRVYAAKTGEHVQFLEWKDPQTIRFSVGNGTMLYMYNLTSKTVLFDTQ
jgi:hypothetical protein